jgi:hypothetical protein
MSAIDRRKFLGTSLAGAAAGVGGSRLFGAEKTTADKTAFTPDTLFLTWQRDPTTTMTVQWIGNESEIKDPSISFAVKGNADSRKAATKIRPFPTTDQKVFRAELTDLTPGTEYEFRIGSQSPVYRFRTMPAKATDSFHFISGGDCGVNAHAVANNKVAAKQDPMFALIGGDLAYDDGRHPDITLQFMRNYSQNMIDSDGRLIPMVVCIGNHEVSGGYGKPRKDAPYFFALHDGLYAERSFSALDFGDYLSLVLMDTGHVAPIDGEQTDWLDKTLAAREGFPNLIVVNHVPAYPSYRPAPSSEDGKGSTGEGNRKHWSPLFEKYNVDVVLEHHDHTFKRTHPMKDGHIDPSGIVYLGDGSWGKLRAPQKPEERPYLATTHQAYHLTLHRLEGEQRFHMAIDEDGKVIDICNLQKKARKTIG